MTEESTPSTPPQEITPATPPTPPPPLVEPSTPAPVVETPPQEQIDFLEEQAQWLPRVLEEDPELLALRERTLQWTGGISFANMIHTALTASPIVFNRYSILNLIYNHFLMIGMENTAAVLENECGHHFQVLKEPWDRSGLRILTSLGVLNNEDPWNVPLDPNCKFIEESVDEDMFACKYTENPREIYHEILDPTANTEFKGTEKLFTDISALSLRRLAVFAAFGKKYYHLRDDDIATIYLTLQSYTTNEHFLQHLITIYNLDFNEETAIYEISSKIPDYKLCVVTAMQKWIGMLGLFIGKKTIKLMQKFAQMIVESADKSQDIVECQPICKNILEIISKIKYGQTEIPSPIMVEPKITADTAQKLFSPKFLLINVDPTEVARQITISLYEIYARIPPREFYIALQNKTFDLQTQKINEFFDLAHKFERALLEMIVKHTNKVECMQFIINLSIAIELMNNYTALYSIFKVLTIPELKNVIKAAGCEQSIINLNKKLGPEAEALQWYQTTINSRFEAGVPAIPNLLIDVFNSNATEEPSFIDGKINWQKRMEISRTLRVLYKFQNCPYGFWPVVQIQKVFLTAGQMPEKVLIDAFQKVSALSPQTQ